jgi:hypothetical protein
MDLGMKVHEPQLHNGSLLKTPRARKSITASPSYIPQSDSITFDANPGFLRRYAINQEEKAELVHYPQKCV